MISKKRKKTNIMNKLSKFYELNKPYNKPNPGYFIDRVQKIIKGKVTKYDTARGGNVNTTGSVSVF